jgi:hypothetical protein
MVERDLPDLALAALDNPLHADTKAAAVFKPRLRFGRQRRSRDHAHLGCTGWQDEDQPPVLHA